MYHDARHGADADQDELCASWQQTPWGRFLVGLLLAQGLYYVLRHLCTAGFMVAQEKWGNDVWATLTGLVVLQAIQAVSILTAGMLTGAGQRRGFFFGAVVGVWNAVFFILVQIWTAQALTTLDLFCQPVLEVAFGALGRVGRKPHLAAPRSRAAACAAPQVLVAGSSGANKACGLPRSSGVGAGCGRHHDRGRRRLLG